MAVTIPLNAADRFLLRSADTLSTLEEADFCDLVDGARGLRCDRGECLFEQDEAANAFFVVLQGWLTLQRDQADGTRTVIRIVGPGETIGEALLAPGARYPLSAEAVCTVRVVKIESARLRALIAADPPLCLSVLAASCRQLAGLVDQIEHLRNWSIERRVAGMLLQMCQCAEGACCFNLPVEQNVIAARLAVTPPTLSRVFRKLEPLGIEARRGHITIRDVASLARFVRGQEPALPEARP